MTKPREVGGFDGLRRLLRALPQPDEAAAAACRTREAGLTKPPGALGRLEELAEWVSAWQGRHPPRLDRIGVVVFAANHGVAVQGVSAYPAEVTAQMVANFRAGGAAINQLARQAEADLRVVPLELDTPTDDFTDRSAMDEAACVAAFDAGLTAVDPELDLLALGEMGIANTTAAASLCAALLGGNGADWAGPGTGLDTEQVALKARVIDRALARHAGTDDPLEILRRLGGREIAALAGAIVAARLRRVPVLLDGFVVGAAALVLHRLDATALDHCRAGHLSAEPGHARLLSVLGQEPLLRLGMRLGEASGAALAIPLVRAALACHVGMATFAEAGVSDRH